MTPGEKEEYMAWLQKRIDDYLVLLFKCWLDDGWSLHSSDLYMVPHKLEIAQ